MQHEQLSIVDEQAMTGPSRWILERMIEPVTRLNQLADQSDQYWDATGVWAPLLHADASIDQVETFNRSRGQLDELVAVYEYATGRRDWTRDFEALTGWAVQPRGRFMRRPVKWASKMVSLRPIPFFSYAEYEAAQAAHDAMMRRTAPRG